MSVWGSVLINRKKNEVLEKNRPEGAVLGKVYKVGSTRIERKSNDYVKSSKTTVRERLFKGR